MRNSIIKIFCILLVILMLVPLALSCADTADDPDQTSGRETEPTDEPTDDNLDANGFWRDDLPADLDFDDYKFTIYRWTDVEHEEFTVADLTGEPVNDAIYKRNRAVEERLGVKFDFIGSAGNSGNAGTFANQVYNIIAADTKEFDLIAAYSQAGGTTASKNICYNLLDCNYLNFDQPWWPNRLISEASINDKLYFASGDISANMLYMMYVTYFNKKLISEYSLEDPYDLVRDNKWTIDKFLEMCNGVYLDLNGNQKKDQEDRFGYMTSSTHVDTWIYSCDLTMVTKDSNGSLMPSDTFFGERAIDVISKLNSAVHGTDDSIFTGSVIHQRAFNEDRLLFASDRSRISITQFSNENLEYGIVPTPKFDEAQEDYITCMGNPFTLYMIPINTTDADRAAAVMECLASENFRQLTPALFEVTLKIKYSSDEVSSQMYDLIRESVSFDLGRIFAGTLIGQSHFRNAIAGNQATWASTSASAKMLMTTKLNELMKIFE